MASLSGIIREDMTFGSGDVVSLSGNVQIASGYTVTFGAGSSLQGNSEAIEVFGSLVISGTSANLVEVEEVRIYGKKGGSTTINYSHVDKGRLYPTFQNDGDLSILTKILGVNIGLH